MRKNMKKLKFKIALFLLKIVSNNAPVSIADYAEINRLLIKAGRRCAYDLKHAAGSIFYSCPREAWETQGNRAKEDYEIYERRAHMWLDIFNPADDGKQYRDRLHHTIDDAERKLEIAIELLKTNGIEIPETIDSGIPF